MGHLQGGGRGTHSPVVACGVLGTFAGLTTTLAGVAGADWWLAGSCRLTAILWGLAAGRDGLPPIFPELAEALCGPAGALCGLDTTDWGADTEWEWWRWWWLWGG